MLKEKKIVASIIANSQKELEERFSKIKNNVDIIQLDIMDGKFVEDKSMLFNFVLPKSNKTVEAHLMIEDPSEWINAVGDRVDTIIFHFESTKHPEKIINSIRRKGKKVGIAIAPKTRIFEVQKLLAGVDQVLVFTADRMGRYGAKFSKSSIEKIDVLAKTTELLIEVDGGINKNTINEVSKKGANLFVCGSALQRSDDLDQTIKELEELF